VRFCVAAIISQNRVNQTGNTIGNNAGILCVAAIDLRKIDRGISCDDTVGELN
jgi:hypothetical protein